MAIYHKCWNVWVVWEYIALIFRQADECDIVARYDGTSPIPQLF